jgi:hypothetical protein
MTKNMKKIFLGMLLMFGVHSAQASFNNSAQASLNSGTLGDPAIVGLSSAPGTDLSNTTGAGNKIGGWIGTGLAYTVKGATHRHARLFYLFILYRLDAELAKFEKLEKENGTEWEALLKTPEFANYAACTNKTMFKISYCLNKATGGVGSRLSAIGSRLSVMRGVPGWIVGGITAMLNGVMAKSAKLVPEVSIRSVIRIVGFGLLIGLNSKQDFKKILSFISSVASGMFQKMKS